MRNKFLHAAITKAILESFFTVNKTLSRGLPTDAYRNALAIELEWSDLKVEKNYSVSLKYRDAKIGDLYADFLIDKNVLVKVVSVDSINKQIEDEAKLLLRSSEYEVCLVLNSSGDNDYKRIILTNDYKKPK